MDNYTYKAFTADGEKISGSINVNSKNQAKDYLIEKNYTPIEIKKVSKLNIDVNDLFKKNLKTKI